MSDLLFHFTSEDVIRGTSTSKECGQAFSVYDFIDLVSRPHGQTRKRGNFSRRVWTELTSKQSRGTNAIKDLSFMGDIRKSRNINLKFSCPVMSVYGLQMLLNLLRLKCHRQSTSNPSVDVERATRFFKLVYEDLERYMTGDRSMIEEVQTEVSETATGLKRKIKDVGTVTKKRKEGDTGTSDLVLALPGGMTIRGLRTPDAPAHIFQASDVPGEVFSVYDLIDVVYRQLNPRLVYHDISRSVWLRLLNTSEGREELGKYSWEASLRCGVQCTRRVKTPVTGMHELRRLLIFFELDCMPHMRSSHRRGRRPNDYRLGHSERCRLEAFFERCMSGDRSAIRDV